MKILNFWFSILIMVSVFLKQNIKSLIISKTKMVKYSGVGGKKRAMACVTLTPGTGKMIVNSLRGEQYFQFNSHYIETVKSPLVALGLGSTYDIYTNPCGGGLEGQAEAIKLGAARALCSMSEEYQIILSSRGFLTRDARRKERKKCGLKKARKASQFSKR